MSFLANLRQQHSSKQSLQLYYWLSHHPQDNSLMLELILQESAEKFGGKPQTYQLNREHLHTPPGFLSPLDIDILQSLITLEPKVLGKPQIHLPPASSWPLFQSLIRTRRCVFKTLGQQRPLTIIEGPNLNADIAWQINLAGHYFAAWRIQEKPHLCFAALDKHLIYIDIQAKQAILGTAQFAQAPVNQDTANQESINFATINRLSFAAYTQTPNLPQGLAAPPVLPLEQRESQVQILLVCDNLNRQQGKLSMQVSLIDAHVCSLGRDINQHSEETLLEHYWDGSKLCQLKALSPDHNLEKVQQIIHDICGKPTHNAWHIESEQSWRQLLIEQRQALQALGVTFVKAKNFKFHFLAWQSWLIDITENNEQNVLFDIQLQTQENSIPLREVLAQLQQYNRETQAGECSIALSDGRILLIPAKQAQSLLDELEGIELGGQGFMLEKAQSYRLANIHTAVGETSHWQGELDSLNRSIAVQQSPAVLDTQFSAVNAQLRPYQWLGVCWVHHLKQHGFNGLLADDMGLGKTLQTIALLAFEKQQGVLQAPCLVVVPLSLIHNWVSEINKFAPQLKTCVIHGAKRHQHWSSLKEYDVLISTYHSLYLDINQWQQQPLAWLILDEAQHIKNPRTRWSQALKYITSQHRLCLSGTPVENHLGELWSIMDFLMPGSLGSQSYFQQHFRKAIEIDANAARLEQLLKRVAPFMLRRTKDQIAQDLPPKTEIVQRIELDTEQRHFYDELKRETQQALQAQLESNEGNTGTKQMAALNAILRLRQACCDPSLLPQAEAGLPSAKKEACIEMITSLVEQKRSILVFSQFTQMLNLLKEALDQRSIDNLSLCGSTRNRAQVVADFQQGKAPVFLISLKAGGTGLNLTRADTVIHYDPWWNVSLEKQASDRAHRIGQDKPVFVYKLIAADTIEEKVEQLQAKKALISQHIDREAQTNANAFALNFEQILQLVYQDE